jgi:hypothetical protein
MECTLTDHEQTVKETLDELHRIHSYSGPFMSDCINLEPYAQICTALTNVSTQDLEGLTCKLL